MVKERFVEIHSGLICGDLLPFLAVWLGLKVNRKASDDGCKEHLRFWTFVGNPEGMPKWRSWAFDRFETEFCSAGSILILV